jgi:hypothetical protein
MSIEAEFPALKIYAGGECRVVSAGDIGTEIDEVLLGGMQGDLLVDAQRRIFRLWFENSTDMLVARLVGAANPIEVVEQHALEAIDDLLEQAYKSGNSDVRQLVDGWRESWRIEKTRHKA